MSNKTKNQLKNRLQVFLKEFAKVCKKSNRDVHDIQILYATKYLDDEPLILFLEAAQNLNITPIIIGENRVQDAEKKFQFLIKYYSKTVNLFYPVMIGPLQTNKINKAIGLFKAIHSLDSLEIAQSLHKRLERINKKISVFLEVNIVGEAQKHGIPLSQVPKLITNIRQMKTLNLKGLMTLPPQTESPESSRPHFQKLKHLAGTYNLQTSMGTSQDWQVAIEEGADLVRIGSRIFVNRQFNDKS